MDGGLPEDDDGNLLDPSLQVTVNSVCVTLDIEHEWTGSGTFSVSRTLFFKNIFEMKNFPRNSKDDSGNCTNGCHNNGHNDGVYAQDGRGKRMARERDGHVRTRHVRTGHEQGGEMVINHDRITESFPPFSLKCRHCLGRLI